MLSFDTPTSALPILGKLGFSRGSTFVVRAAPQGSSVYC